MTSLDTSLVDRTVVEPLLLQRFSRAKWNSSIKRLSKVSALRSTLVIARIWGIIVLAMALAIWSRQPLVYLLSMVVIALQQHALQVITHEAAHWLLYENRVLNDAVSDFFAGFTFGVATSLYRHTHMQHHRFINSERDPDTAFWAEEPEWKTWPKTRVQLWTLLLKNGLGLSLLKTGSVMRTWSPVANFFKPLNANYPLRSRIVFVAFALTVAGLCWALGSTTWNVLLLWVVPGVTITNVVSRVRASAEHLGTSNVHEVTATRTVLPTLWERVLLAPMGVNFHLEHHLFPSVPYRKLHELHALLMEDPSFRARAVVVHSYRAVFEEWMAEGQKPRVSSEAKMQAAA